MNKKLSHVMQVSCLALLGCTEGVSSETETPASPATVQLSPDRCPEQDDFHCLPGNEPAYCSPTSPRGEVPLPCTLVNKISMLPNGDVTSCRALEPLWELCDSNDPNVNENVPMCPDADCMPGSTITCENGETAAVCEGGLSIMSDEDGNLVTCLDGIWIWDENVDCEAETRGKYKRFGQPVTIVDTFANHLELGADTRIPPGAWVPFSIDPNAKNTIANFTIVVSKHDTGISFTQPPGAPFFFSAGEGWQTDYPFIFPMFGRSYTSSWPVKPDANGRAWFLNDTRAPIHVRISLSGIAPRFLPF